MASGWWLLLAHLTLVFVLAVVLLHSVQGKQFAISQEGKKGLQGHSDLAQPEVVAIVSAVLTIIRALAGAAITQIGWRMAFLALGTRGATLAQVDKMISWRRPPLKGQIMLWVVFLLSVPSQFTAPVVQGAINWIPDTHYVFDRRRSITTPGPTIHWRWHNEFASNRYYEVQRAVGIASLASRGNFNKNATPELGAEIPSRRLVPTLAGVKVGSKVFNVSLPIFKIHSLQWARSIKDVGYDLELLNSVIANRTAPAFSYSNWLSTKEGAPNFFNLDTDPGRLVLVNKAQWQEAPQDEDDDYIWPSSRIASDTKWVIVSTRWNVDDCSDLDIFGGVKDVYVHYHMRTCCLFAKIKYTAGTFECKDCSIVADGVIEAPANYTSNQTVHADPLVDTAITMIPELLFYTKVANSSLAPTWDNLNGYTIGMIATAYQAGWNSLSNTFSQDVMDSTDVSVPVSVLRADITSWRIWLWFGLNASLTMSGLLFGVLQWHSRTDAVAKPALAALLIDPQAIVEGNTSTSHDINSLIKDNISVMLRLNEGGQQLRLVDTVQRLYHREIHNPPGIQGGEESGFELLLEQSSRPVNRC
ncbi:hypothetical protein H2198_001908 [Neophaeococcomyces mojaviensis]|uniref:Uncharacterized protein n=1 Tax=Neophaeococcomyces mojaviensis TaxID=3383035 RepID=A0ACC3AFP4_9EURO|nr:hypothetical protein H2198_001908 [Knufia sp. JES_112]